MSTENQGLDALMLSVREFEAALEKPFGYLDRLAMGVEEEVSVDAMIAHSNEK